MKDVLLVRIKLMNVIPVKKDTGMILITKHVTNVILHVNHVQVARPKTIVIHVLQT